MFEEPKGGSGEPAPPPSATSGPSGSAPPADSGGSVPGKPATPPPAASPGAGVAGTPPPAGKSAAPPGGKPPAPAKPAAKPEPWSSPLLDELQRRFPGAISDPLVFRNQPFFTVKKETLIEVCQFLKSEEGGAYVFLTDETAVDYPKREKRFEINYQLYSFKLNQRLRLKVLAAEGEAVPSVTSVWPAANWLEREVYDMFGVLYDGHPDLRRILLPEEWTGHPLRKDYDILRQDDSWVQKNLGIPSGQ